jgi:cephalosporin hydroxylase
MEFNKEHGSLIASPPWHQDRPVTINDLLDINKRFLGGGMSQNYAAIYLLEYYQQLNKFEYIVELGSQKGALSVYLANAASITEQFLFETFDISTKDWDHREVEGCGHWFRKLETISKYIKFYNADVFSEDTVEHIKEKIKLYKTLIICDGGDKSKEFNIYSRLIKSGDHIITHDWPAEINQHTIDIPEGVVLDTPWDSYFQSLKTLFKAFKKI